MVDHEIDHEIPFEFIGLSPQFVSILDWKAPVRKDSIRVILFFVVSLGSFFYAFLYLIRIVELYIFQPGLRNCLAEP